MVTPASTAATVSPLGNTETAGYGGLDISPDNQTRRLSDGNSNLYSERYIFRGSENWEGV